MRRTLALGLAFSLLFSRAARADEAAVEQAKASFKAGAAAYAAGDYLAAIQALDSAYRATPLPAIAFSLAQAERRQYFVSHEPEHLSRAITLYRGYLTQVPVGGRRADAADALAQLEPIALSFKDTATTLSAPLAPAEEKTRLLVTGRAPAAHVSLDGAPAVPSPLIREVEPGPHTVRVEAEGFFPEERRVVAVAGVLVPADVELREQPAVILLRGVEGADVYIDARFAGRAEKLMRLELTSGSHTLILAKAGAHIERVPLTLARGETRPLALRLRNTTQRTASLVLFGTGGGLVTGGVWMGALALAAEAEGIRLIHKRGAENITTKELSDYRDTVRARNQLRTASLVSLCLGGAAVVTGLSLFELDPPNLGEVLRTPANRAGRPRRLSLSPAAEGIGLDAQLTF